MKTKRTYTSKASAIYRLLNAIAFLAALNVLTLTSLYGASLMTDNEENSVHGMACGTLSLNTGSVCNPGVTNIDCQSQAITGLLGCDYGQECQSDHALWSKIVEGPSKNDECLPTGNVCCEIDPTGYCAKFDTGQCLSIWDYYYSYNCLSNSKHYYCNPYPTRPTAETGYRNVAKKCN